MKSEIRKRMKAMRSALRGEEILFKSKAMCTRFSDHFDIKKYNCIHLFQSIRKFGEPETSLFMESIHKISPNAQIAIPIVDPAADRLIHVILSNDIELVPNAWGIPEPVMPWKPISTDKIDLVLVPMLAFDSVGNRIGYGKGYYDRFLASLNANVPKVGLCYSFGKIDTPIPAEAHDVKLDYVITENEVISFRKTQSK